MAIMRPCQGRETGPIPVTRSVKMHPKGCIFVTERQGIGYPKGTGGLGVSKEQIKDKNRKFATQRDAAWGASGTPSANPGSEFPPVPRRGITRSNEKHPLVGCFLYGLQRRGWESNPHIAALQAAA